MLRRLFIGERNALSPVLSVVLVLAIVMPAIGTIFLYGIPAINDLNEQKETEKGKNILGSVAEEVTGLTNSEFKDSTTVDFNLGKDSSVTVDTGTDRTVLMYSTDPGYSFTVSNFENIGDSFFYLDAGSSLITRLQADYYFIDPTRETCFLAGTKILMADESRKNIEDVCVGDSVKSYDEKSGTLTDGVVTHVFSHTPDEMGDYYLVINNQLRVTPNHRFYSDGKWVYASDLKIGDPLFTGSSSSHDYIIYSIDKIFNKVPTFDLEIENCHTYLVSLDCDKVDVLVHNPTINSPPKAPSIPSGPGSGTVGVSYTYSTSTTDPDGDNVFYWFDWGDGTNSGWVGPCPSGKPGSASHSWGSAATYSVKAKAKDTSGSESGWSGLLTVIISSPNQPPNIPLTPDGPSVGLVGILYDYGTQTTDPEGDQVWYNFSWGDGTYSGWLGPYPSGVKCTGSHSWSSVGFYSVKVKAKDAYSESGWSGILTVRIRANNNPTAPSKPFGNSTCLIGESVTYSASATDSDGDNLYYWFDWGDGNNSGWVGPYASGATASASHSWSSVGSYSVKVKANDTWGAESAWSSILVVTVKARPTLAINTPSEGQTVRDTITISGTANDPDGTVQKVQVSFDHITWIDLTPPLNSWSYQWNTKSVVDGPYTIYARSYDNDGYYSVEASVNVIVQNAAQEQGVPRWKENNKIDKNKGYGTCDVEDLGSNTYKIDLNGKPITGTGVIDLYDDDHYFGSIWFFDSKSITYEPSNDQLSSLIIENGLLLDKNGYSSTVRDIPNIIDRNGILSLSIYQLVQSPGSTISVTGGNSRINLKSYGSGMSIRDRFNTIYDFKMQFYGDNSNAWVNYLADPNNYLNFESTTSNSVERSGSVNLVLWHTYIEFGISI